MKSTTIRIIILLALLSAAGIIITQTFWVRKAIALEEKEFNYTVHSALRDVAVKVMELKQNQVPVYSPVTQLKPDYFIVQAGVYVEKDILEHYLVQAFTKEGLMTDFEYGLYDCMTDTVDYQGYYHMQGSNEPVTTRLKFPLIKKENYYFGVYFPQRKSYLSSQLSIWIISSAVLLCVLAFLGYMLFIIFKQKRLSEVQKDFVNNMTHEFKTPLSSIQLSAEIIKTPSVAGNPQRLINYATLISNEAIQLTNNVERVLQMAHADKDGVMIRKEPIVWQELLKEEAQSFENILENTGGKIILNMPDEPVHYLGDALHLKNTISNLVDNAIKYCEVPPEIFIFLRETKNEISISVKDNGIGIDKKHMKLLFEKFYRVPTGDVHNVKGFGLGLNYVRLMVRLHGGKVTCTSIKDKGTEFFLSFPKKTN